ncbi:hypothetical protein NL676_039430 [Syzygium grande]|nr:hypothetical protein NL676_039430 [Syzygium grande]
MQSNAGHGWPLVRRSEHPLSLPSQRLSGRFRDAEQGARMIDYRPRIHPLRRPGAPDQYTQFQSMDSLLSDGRRDRSSAMASLFAKSQSLAATSGSEAPGGGDGRSGEMRRQQLRLRRWPWRKEAWGLS